MNALAEFWRRLLFLLRRGRFDRDLEREMQTHLELLADDHAARGMDADEARHAARRAFGNATYLRETSHDAWGWGWLDGLRQDVGYACRMLRRNPGFATVAILTLALGIGGNTAIVSQLDRLFLRPPPFADPGRLVALSYRYSGAEMHGDVSYADYRHYRDRTRLLTDLGAYDMTRAVAQFEGDEAENLDGEIVTASYFSVLAVRPEVGRWWPADEDERNAATSVVISHALWQTRFNGDPNIVGRTLILDRRPFTVVGVAGPTFAGFRLDRANPPAFWAPIAFRANLRHEPGNQSLATVGRLKPGVALPQASAEFRRLGEELKQGPWRELWRDLEGGPLHWTASLVPGAEARLGARTRGEIGTSLAMITAVAGLVLAIACVNVATLLLSRSAARQRELAVRLSLGAGRARVARQLATEALVLSALGATAGLLVAVVTLKLLAVYLPFRFSVLVDPTVDLRMVGVAAALSVAVAVVFGLVPGRESLRTDLTSALRTGGRTRLARRWMSPQHAFLVVQTAICVVLLVGAGLFLRTLHNARATDVTVDANRVLMTRVNPTPLKLDAPGERQLYADLLDRVARLRWVESAALVMVVPMGGGRGGTDVIIRTPEQPATDRKLQVDFNVVSPAYFRTIGIPVLQGRAFTDADRDGAPPVAIVNEAWARRFWPGRSPIGERFLRSPDRVLEVVGVVRDGRFRGYRAAIKPCFYVPVGQTDPGPLTLEVRTASTPAAAAPLLRRELRAFNGGLTVAPISTIEAYRDSALGQERMQAALLASAGAVALALATIGLYGVMAFSVSRRTREIGIRVAVGAHRGRVLRMVLAQGLMLTLVGLAVGLAAAAAMTRLVSTLLYGVDSMDPWTLAASALVLAGASLAGCYVPARRAAQIDPMSALRCE
jgi:putative ABC transport system permease protein